MKRLISILSQRAPKIAGAAALLLMSASASYAQSGPFATFAGSWSGTGTISMSDGSSERIRCRASYTVAGQGTGLQQTLRCASDSYRFDLSSDVTASGSNVSGTWSETSRGINGSLQGRAAGGRVDVLVEAAGFAASLTMTTNGNRQSVLLSSKGDIKGVSISMTRS